MKELNRSRRAFLERLGTTVLWSGAIAAMPFAVRSKMLADTPNDPNLVGGNPLRLPSTITGGKISASVGTQSVWNDRATSVWMLGGSYPAPTIRLKRGDRFQASLTNSLEMPTNIHWHGLFVPPDMDGHPMDVVAPGATKNYDFAVDQRAGIYWYHPHPDMETGRQVYMGMAGFFIVEDDEERALGLPSGEYEIPLVIQDRRDRSDRAFDYTLQMPDMMAGMLGDTILANGTPNAEVEVASTLYRFRLLNGSNARVYNLALSDGAMMYVIGTDGGLLDRSYPVKSFFLAPGERVDLLIDLSSYKVGDTVRLVAENFDGAINWRMQGWGGDVLALKVARAGTPMAVPSTLVSLERLNPDQAVATRTFELKMIIPMPVTGMHTINGRVFEGDRIDETVMAGDVEIWEFVNTSDEPHPIHIHNAMFQVIDRDGKAPDSPKDFGWKDTVIVWGAQKVRVAVRFGAHDGLYILHCHNLEHEDDGMMMNYKSLPRSSGVTEETNKSSASTKIDLR